MRAEMGSRQNGSCQNDLHRNGYTKTATSRCPDPYLSNKNIQLHDSLLFEKIIYLNKKSIVIYHNGRLKLLINMAGFFF
jgi:hypothetical protein